MLHRPVRLLAGPVALLTIATGLIVTASPAVALATFQVASAVNLGAPADDVVLADVDGDDDWDQVVNFRSTGQVGVLRNDGPGRFSAPVRFPAVGADHLAAGDLDGDGAADVVVANTDEDSVSVLLATRSGDLAAPVTSPAGADPRDVALADLDGDGVLDVVVGNRSTATVTVLLGDGAGGLSAPLLSAAGDVLGDLGIGDVDGDGTTDLVVSDLAGGRLLFLRGLGDGRFAAPVTALSTPSPVGVVLGDLDGNGTLDVVVNRGATEATATQVRVALGTGSGTFTAPRTYEVVSFYDRQTELALVDVDADGRLDLLVSSDGPEGLDLLYGVGGGALSDEVDIADFDGAEGLAVGDTDGDGDPDLVTASSLSRVYVNSGVTPLTVRFTNPRNFTTHVGPNEVALGDVNVDGRLDAVTASRAADNVSVMIGDGAGGLTRRVFVPTPGDPEALALGDLDGDGDLDIVVARYQARAVTTLRGDGRGGFTAGASLPVPGTPGRLALADVDGDNVLDLVVGSFNTDTAGLGVALGKGDGTFASLSPIAPESGFVIDAADLDADGDVDLVQSVDSGLLQVFYGDGDGRFPNRTDVPSGVGTSFDLEAADVTYDGRLDLVVERAVIPGTAAGFGRPVVSTSASGDFTLSDLDADGRLDKVFGASSSGPISVYPGAGAGLFLPPSTFPSGASSPRNIAVGDLDGDGKPDVVAANEGYNTVSTLRNVSVPTPQDLAATRLTWSVPAAAPGSSFEVRDYTSNLGDAAAGASTTRYRLSLDYSQSNSVPLTGSRAVPSLGAGRTNNGTATVTLPQGLAAGTYRLLACADDLDTVAENDELNNCGTSTQTLVVGPAGPDLEQQVTSAGGQTSVLAGESITAEDWVRNDGTSAAGPFAVRYLLSANTTVGANDILLTGGRTLAGLPAQALSQSGDVVVGVPADTPGREYYLFSCADIEGVVAESDETNNCHRAVGTVRVTAPTVDLFASQYGPIPAEVAAGSSFTLDIATSNTGSVTAPTSRTVLFLQLYFEPGPDDPTVSSLPVPALAPNTSNTRRTTVTIPADTAPGGYQLRICADAAGLVAESDEANNCLYTTEFQVTA